MTRAHTRASWQLRLSEPSPGPRTAGTARPGHGAGLTTRTRPLITPSSPGPRARLQGVADQPRIESAVRCAVATASCADDRARGGLSNRQHRSRQQPSADRGLRLGEGTRAVCCLPGCAPRHTSGRATGHHTNTPTRIAASPRSTHRRAGSRRPTRSTQAVQAGVARERREPTRGKGPKDLVQPRTWRAARLRSCAAAVPINAGGRARGRVLATGRAHPRTHEAAWSSEGR